MGNIHNNIFFFSLSLSICVVDNSPKYHKYPGCGYCSIISMTYKPSLVTYYVG